MTHLCEHVAGPEGLAVSINDWTSLPHCGDSARVSGRKMRVLEGRPTGLRVQAGSGERWRIWIPILTMNNLKHRSEIVANI